MSESFYTYKCGHTAKYEYIKPDSAKTQSFTLVYAHGFCSDPYGRKPEEIRKWCIENGMGFFRYEIAGHGSDAARFEETTINTYKSQIFEIVGEMVDGDVVTAGASLGGWLRARAGGGPRRQARRGAGAAGQRPVCAGRKEPHSVQVR